LERSYARDSRDLALSAITDLSAILAIAQKHGSTEEFEDLIRPIGLLIGQIETELLCRIYAEHPELDDLK